MTFVPESQKWVYKILSMHSWLAVCIVAVFLNCAGCGDREGLHVVTGRVTLDGQPLVDADVDFHPVEAGQSSAFAVTDADGRFELKFTSGKKGAPVGKYDVSISQVEETPQGDRESLQPIYNEETELTAEVTADGDNQFNFDLKSR